MIQNLRTRFSAVALSLLTLATIVFAWINVQQQREFVLPSDGVWWVEEHGDIVAERVAASGPGARAGIKQGDRLVAIDGVPITSTANATRQIYRAGAWAQATYELLRGNVPAATTVIPVPAEPSLNLGLRAIGLLYLSIGLYVLLRRWTAPKAMHFYLFCLVSFVFYCFRYTGKLNDFDWIIYWSNVVAWLLQPAMFLHFAFTFPERRLEPELQASPAGRTGRQQRLWPASLYLPAALLLATHVALLRFAVPSESLRWNLDRAQMAYLAAYFVAATVVLGRTSSSAATPLLRHQMRWVTRGTALAVIPFTVGYVIPYLQGSLPNLLMQLSVLSMIFLPLTLGYAIVRYRLMDVDLIFKRGMVYTIAAATVAGIYFAAVGAAAAVFHSRFPSVGPAGLIAAIVVTALLFEPVKNWVQDRLDKLFYRRRYDYRKTLIEFGRDLNSETDLRKMMSAITERISRTLLVDRIAIFLRDGNDPDRFSLASSSGLPPTHGLDLGFLSANRPEYAIGHLFFDNPEQALHEPRQAREAIRLLNLNYYIPCTVQNHVIAVLGLGKTTDGNFLSAEDIELLEALAGHIGIALQNARLYASLEQKAQEYERLKEFNENIVESINVGVLALDFQDNIDSWNSCMEVMLGLPRTSVLRRKIRDVLPAQFCDEFYRVRDDPGIHNVYKFSLPALAGDRRLVNVAIAPLLSRNFTVIGRLVILDDITERVELESQLAQADKLSSIGLLAAGVAHEVNTPLAVISSYAQTLSRQLQGDEPKSLLLEKITRQTFRASEIVNNLLNFSRTSGTEFKAVDVNKIIQETLALLEHQFSTAGIRVQGDLAPGLPSVHGNTGKLQQVFLNLFLNSKDAMPQGGMLRVSTSNGSGVLVTIQDTGSGIAAEHIHRIYDPFFTTKPHPSQRGTGGTGLGLSVTYGIIQEHAGKIRVESKRGQGTRFLLEFPMLRKVVNA